MLKNFKFKARYVVYLVLFLLGSSIIFLAIAGVRLFFFSGSADATNLTNTYEEFVIAYSDNYNENDLPEGIEISRSICDISDDGKYYSYKLTLKYTGDSMDSLCFQVFFGDEFTDAYGDITNPFISVTETDGVLVSTSDEISYDYASVVFGDLDEFKENFQDIYLEVMVGDYIGRILLPVEFI